MNYREKYGVHFNVTEHDMNDT